MAIRNGTAGNDAIFGTNYADYISGFAGHDNLTGAAGDDYIYGGDGRDAFSDGTGNDRLFGQRDADDFFMDIGGGTDFVDGGWGIDLIFYDQASGLTRVDFLDNSANLGAAAGDQFVSVEAYRGGRATDRVFGDNGMNQFFASLGNDQYLGRGGTDVYYARPILGANESITTFEIAFGARAATLAAAAGIAPPAAAHGVAFYEIWDDANTNSIEDAGEVTRHADVFDSIEIFVGTNGADKMIGSAANETFIPMLGADQINGGAGSDFLSYELLTGPSVVTDRPTVTVDLALGTAITTQFDPTFAPVERTSTISNIEYVIGSPFDDQLSGNHLANRMAGGDGGDALDGRGGRDSLYGGGGSDIIVGGADIDILSGGAGADTLDGGDGIDIADYSEAATSVAVSLLTGQGLVPIIDSQQIMTAESIGDLLLNLESVVGSTFGDIISGDDGANVLEGRAGNDALYGCDGDDTIYGERNPSSPIADFHHLPSYTDGAIADDCGCESEDELTDSDAAANYSDYIVGGGGADTVHGQLGDDEICGGTGNDTLYGNDGADIIDGEADNDRLEGGLGTDFLYGGSGDDRILGGAGFDVIMGGSGRDTVDYSASPSAVNVSLGEFWRNSGGEASSDLLTEMMTNLVNGEDPTLILQSALFFSLMQMIGSSGTETGFTLTIPDVVLGVEAVVGSAFDDTLEGDSAVNTIVGGNGNDIIDGKGGNDSLHGGNGNDLFRVDTTGDSITEISTGGTDSVESTATFYLSNYVENLTLLGTAAIGGGGNFSANLMTGNSAANVIRGEAGNDTLRGLDGNDNLSGGAGNDTMTGGAGLDKFLFDAPLGGNVDQITDYAPSEDTIWLDKSYFTALGAVGTLSASAFNNGTSALDASDRIIYDSASGRIYYDADGNGGGAQVLFAQIDAGTVMSALEFAIVA